MYTASRLLLLCLLAMCLSACFPMSERKADPPQRYSPVCEKVTTAPDPSDGVVPTDPVAKAVNQARADVRSKRDDYQRIYCSEEWSNKKFNHGLIATAVVGGAAALAKANPYVLGGIGLVGTGVSVLKTYEHPDTDRDAAIKAYGQLACVYDETGVLVSEQTYEQLTKAGDGLRASIDEVRGLLALLPADAASQSAVQKATMKAGQDAISAAEIAMKQIATAITDYRKMPVAIYRAGNTIDLVTRKANGTTGDYTAFKTSIKDALAAATKDSAGKEATTQATSRAEGSTEAAVSALGADQPRTPAANSAHNVMYSLLVRNTTNLGFVARANLAPAVSHVFADSATGAIVSLNKGTAYVTDHLPSPLYSEVISNITACSAGG